MKLKSKVFNGIEYTLVDFYNWNEKEIITHFAGDESDLFCKYIDNQHVPIKDLQFIDEILEYYYLKKPQVFFSGIKETLLFPKNLGNIKELTSALREKIIKEQIEKLNDLENSVDSNILYKRLENFKYYTGDEWEASYRALCYPALDAIFLQDKNIKSEDIISKRYRLHETIHALTGKKYHMTQLVNKLGMQEGATENIVEKLYGYKTSSYRAVGEIQFDFSKETEYHYQVALIRQMETALGKECNESILTGNNDFYNEFGKQYGKDTLRFIRHRTNRLLNPYKVKDEVEYFKETQNTVLQKIFDKDFEHVETSELAKEYFEKLQSFELTRGRIKGDTFFEEYYNEKFEKAKEKLISKGESVEELTKFEYKESEFYPITTKEEKNQHMLDLAAKEIPKHMVKGEDITSQLENFKLYTAKQGEFDRILVTKNENPIYMQYGNNKDGWGESTLEEENSYLSKITNEDGTFKMNIGDENNVEFQEFPLQNMDELEKRIDKLMNDKEDMTIQEKTSFLQKINPINQIKQLYKKISMMIKNRNIKRLPPGKDIEKTSEVEESFSDKRKKMLAELTKNAPTLEEQKLDSIKRNNKQQKENITTNIQIDRE